jgi:hypothetical protein
LQPKTFWQQVKQNAREHNADEILSYMSLMLEEARHKKISVTRQRFVEFGRGVELFDGVTDWFDRLDQSRNLSGALHHIVGLEGDD